MQRIAKQVLFQLSYIPMESYPARRNTALILLLVDVGPRRAEVAGMRLTDLMVPPRPTNAPARRTDGFPRPTGCSV